MATKKRVSSAPETVDIPPINLQRIKLRIVGDTSLITHKFSDASIKGIEAKQQHAPLAPRGARNPEQEYEDAKYKLPDGRCAMIGAAFKRAAVEACRMVPNMPMTEARVLFHVLDDLVLLEGEPEMRTDMRRLESGTFDPVYRPEFKEWACEITVVYNAGMMSQAQLVNLFNLAGLGGVGDWRASAPKGKSGNHGMFHIEEVKPVKVRS